jgi:hypothetical protein
MGGKKIAIAGAGIYGSTIAIMLARNDYDVTVFDPLGVMRAASSINQLRIHSGYHYPRSFSTIKEILESRIGFIKEYQKAVVRNTDNYYAIPHEGSLTTPEKYEEIYNSFSLILKKVSPEWINFDYISSCYKVKEEIYDPLILKTIIEDRFKELKISFINEMMDAENSQSYDLVVYATYGASGSHQYLFNDVQKQIAEKILIKLPENLQKKSLVVVDGQFTAFDPYGNTKLFQFGSAKHTNHWKTDDPEEPIPDEYKNHLNGKNFIKVNNTNFEKMVEESTRSVPLTKHAEYLGSKFTIRLVENDSTTDRRILRVKQSDSRTFHVFSGKVVGAVKAADIIYTLINKLCFSKDQLHRH